MAGVILRKIKAQGGRGAVPATDEERRDCGKAPGTNLDAQRWLTKTVNPNHSTRSFWELV